MALRRLSSAQTSTKANLSQVVNAMKVAEKFSWCNIKLVGSNVGFWQNELRWSIKVLRGVPLSIAL